MQNFNIFERKGMFLNTLVSKLASFSFARVMRFKENEEIILPPGDGKERLLYIHIPFCERLCPYCSFHRLPFQEELARRYFVALKREIEIYKKLGYTFTGTYVGGGTPTVLIEELEDLLHFVRYLFPIKEISVETNPNHLTDNHLAALQRAKVNRLSVGVQSFDDGLLKAMDRYEKYGSGETIYQRLSSIHGSFATINTDMIFNFPTQDEAMIDRDLDRLLSLQMEQITYYPLMVSATTKMAVEKSLGMVDYKKESNLYERIVERLSPVYNFSSAWCFSLKKSSPIDEYIVDYDEYAGAGSGAIGYLKGMCYANTFDLLQYISLLEKGRLPLKASRHFTKREQILYDFLMKLFSTRIDQRALKEKYPRYAGFLELVFLTCLSLGALKSNGPYLYLTAKGRYLWVILMREFFIAVNNFRDYCRKQISLKS